MSEPKDKLIGGIKFSISQPYDEGHVCTQAEARALNQTRSENIGNNVRAKLKEMQDAGKSAEELAAFVSEIDQNYVFNLASVSAARKMDPYEREAEKIAKELLKAHLATTGRKLSVTPEGVTEDEWNAKIQSELDRISTSPDVIKVARKNVDAKKKTADTLLESLGGVSV